MTELKACLGKLKEEAKALKERGERGQHRAADLRLVANLVQEATDSTETYEEEDRELHDNRASQGLNERMGAHLKMRNIRVPEAVGKWDKDGSGAVDLKEFLFNVKTLGFKAEPKELEQLFNWMDDDKSGVRPLLLSTLTPLGRSIHPTLLTPCLL